VTFIRLKHVDRFRDRHGKWRYYFRLRRGARIPLRGDPGSTEFVESYQAAQRGEAEEQLQPKLRGNPGSFDRLTLEYFASPEYLRLADSTRRTYRLVIERLIRDEKIGHRLVREMTREHVRRIISKRAATPGMANSVLQKIKVLLRFAIDNGWRRDDPSVRIKKFAKGEFHTWTEDEIGQYERRWPIGTLERLGFALLLYTGQRRSDVVGMSWSDVEDDVIQVVPLKTKHSTGVKLTIPIHPALAEVLAACQERSGALLRTSFGKPFTGNGFGNFMADKIEDARLPERCVTHGLRKAAARRLAEAGCSANEIAAITGHATLAEVSRYTKAAEQKRLAKAAMRRLERSRGITDSQTIPSGLGIVGNKPSGSGRAGEGWWSRGESNP
jgi:integrase